MSDTFYVGVIGSEGHFLRVCHISILLLCQVVSNIYSVGIGSECDFYLCVIGSS